MTPAPGEEPEPPGGGPLPLSPLPRGKLAEAAAAQILDGIRERALSAGARIPSERELMAALGVGRSTIREAINGLAMLGVLEIRHGQGAFVVDPDASGAASQAVYAALAQGVTRDLFEARRVIEPHVARLAATRRTDSDLREIAACLADHERAIRERESTVGASVRFHLRIADAAHNEVLAGLVDALREPLTERGPLLEALPGYLEWEIEQHRSVFESIRGGEPEAAAERMRAHLDAVAARHEDIGSP